MVVFKTALLTVGAMGVSAGMESIGIEEKWANLTAIGLIFLLFARLILHSIPRIANDNRNAVTAQQKAFIVAHETQRQDFLLALNRQEESHKAERAADREVMLLKFEGLTR